MFKVLAAHPHLETLDLASGIVRKAHAVQSGAVEISLCEGAKFLVINGPNNKRIDGGRREKKDVGQADSKGAPASPGPRRTAKEESGVCVEAQPGDGLPGHDSGAAFEPLEPLVMAVLASTSEPWLEAERGRKSRVELAQALAERGVKDPAALAAILDPWLLEERSRPLREAIDRARQANQQP